VGGNHSLVLNKRTGKEVWRALSDEASYSAPILIEQAGKRVLICWTGENVAGLDPQNGRLFWIFPSPAKRDIINVATPVWSKPYLFLTSFYDGSLLLKLDDNKLEKVTPSWRFLEGRKIIRPQTP